MFGRKQKPNAAPVEIEIFRAGTHRGINGQEVTITPEDVQAVVDGFNPDTAPVPVVVGHPRHDAPAYAWAEAIYLEGETLKARLKEIDPAFAEILKAGRYKRISAAFFPPDSPANPTPGQYSLRHIGFLGAAAPAVKGLQPVEFTTGRSGLDWFW